MRSAINPWWVIGLLVSGCRSSTTATPTPAPPTPTPVPVALDRDHDLVLDRCDQCPDQPEPFNGLADTDGCPDRSVSYVARPFGPWGIGFAAGSLEPDAEARVDVDALASQIARWDLGAELSGCTDPGEPAELAGQRAGWLHDQLRARRLPEERLRIAGVACASQGVDGPHRRWASATPIVTTPSTPGCPVALPPLALPTDPTTPPTVTPTRPKKRPCKPGLCFYPDSGCIKPGSSARNGTGPCSGCNDEGYCESTR